MSIVSGIVIFIDLYSPSRMQHLARLLMKTIAVDAYLPEW